MQRRVDEANSGRSAAKRLEDAFEVFSLKNKEFVESCLSLMVVSRQNHRLHDGTSLLCEEHMFRSAKPDSLSAEFDCKGRVFRGIGVGKILQLV